MPAYRGRTSVVFPTFVALVYGSVFLIARGAAGVAHPGVIGIAGLCDLMVTVPLVYWVLVMRGGGGSWTTLAMLSLAGARAAATILPAAGAYRAPIYWLGVPVELWVVARVLRRMRGLDASGDALTRIRAACGALLRNRTAANIVAAEIAVFYYALFSWRSKPGARSGERAFGYAEASGWSLFPIIIGAAILFEGVPIHLVLSKWSHAGAWIWTSLDAYAVLWVIAAGRACYLRPILVTHDKLLVRNGLLWEVEVPTQAIRACRRSSGPAPRRTPGFLRLTVINDPQWILEFSRTVVARNIYGGERNVRAVAFSVDNNTDFSAAFAGKFSVS